MATVRELPTPLSPSPLAAPPVRAPLRPSPPDPARRDPPSPFATLVRGLAHEADRGEATVQGVLGASGQGVTLDAAHLLALQAGIYRYGETMDLAAQLVDKASSGVKTVIQGQ